MLIQLVKHLKQLLDKRRFERKVWKLLINQERDSMTGRIREKLGLLQKTRSTKAAEQSELHTGGPRPALSPGSSYCRATALNNHPPCCITLLCVKKNAQFLPPVASIPCSLVKAVGIPEKCTRCLQALVSWHESCSKNSTGVIAHSSQNGTRNYKVEQRFLKLDKKKLTVFSTSALMPYYKDLVTLWNRTVSSWRLILPPA